MRSPGVYGPSPDGEGAGIPEGPPSRTSRSFAVLSSFGEAKGQTDAAPIGWIVSSAGLWSMAHGPTVRGPNRRRRLRSEEIMIVGLPRKNIFIC